MSGENGQPRPYGSQALRYLTHGWPSPLPVGLDGDGKWYPKRKSSPPPGYTGRNGKLPDEDQLAKWVRNRADMNIALRAPDGVVGLDVDAYKDGSAETMKAISEAHGALPRTWVSTSKTDLSGTRWFANPRKLEFNGVIKHPDGSDKTAGEVIQPHHRYGIVWPSIHPDGDPYFWLDQTTGARYDDGTIPKVDDLPDLPDAWADHLTGVCSCFAGRYDWSKIKATSGDPVADCYDRWHSRLVSGTYARHDAALAGSLALNGFVRQGWPRANEYLAKLEDAFLAAVTSDKSRTPAKARSEWESMVDGADKKPTSIPQWEPPKNQRETVTPPTGRKLKLTPASEIPPRPVRWLWARRIPIGEITLTPGYGGVGKSTFHSWVIAQVTRGLLDGVHQGRPRPAIICASEDSWSRSVVPRLIAADADLNLVYRAEVVSDEDENLKLTLPADLDKLTAEVGDRGIALVSLDPLLSTIDGEIDTYKSREVRDALEPLHQMADETGTVILGNAHFNKASGSDPQLKVSGSQAFNEVCRAMLSFAFDPENSQYVISQSKNNLGRTDLPNLTYQIEPAEIATSEGTSEVGRLVFTGESQRSVRDILSPHQGQDRTERDTARTIILDVLEDGPQAWKAIAKTIKEGGVTERTGRRARDELTKEGKIRLSPGDWTWHLDHPRVGGGQVVKVKQKDSDLDHLVVKDFVNADRDLTTLTTYTQTLRENGGQTLTTFPNVDDLDHLPPADDEPDKSTLDADKLTPDPFAEAERNLTAAGFTFDDETDRISP